jgi:hypothetical protein
MPEVGQIKYDLREITALMLRDQGIRSGLWMIWTRFAQGATNIAPPKDEPGAPAGPGTISVLVEVGIQRVKEPGPLSVDASELWKGEELRRPRKGAGVR